MLKRVITFEEAEEDILRLATPDTHKFAIQLGYTPEQDIQDALERLMLRDWIRLIDVSPTWTATSDGRLMRVFRVMPDALEWLATRAPQRAQGAK